MRVLITGATHGMGWGLARALAAEHEVIVHGRDPERCAATARELAAQTGGEGVSWVCCDLVRLGEVRGAVAELRGRIDSLDAIFVNAGIGYAAERVETEDGLDAHFQVNYLAHFLLVLQLLPLLEASTDGGRIVFNATDFGTVDWDDLQMERSWDYERGVTQAMVCKRMFLRSLHERFRARPGCRLSALGFHTKQAVWTNQLNIIPGPMRFMAGIMKLFGKFISTDEIGARMAPLFTEEQETSLARSGQLLTWEDGAFVPLPHTDEVLDPDNRARLWALTVELCGDPATEAAAAAWG